MSSDGPATSHPARRERPLNRPAKAYFKLPSKTFCPFKESGWTRNALTEEPAETATKGS